MAPAAQGLAVGRIQGSAPLFDGHDVVDQCGIGDPLLLSTQPAVGLIGQDPSAQGTPGRPAVELGILTPGGIGIFRWRRGRDGLFPGTKFIRRRRHVVYGGQLRYSRQVGSSRPLSQKCQAGFDPSFSDLKLSQV